MDADMGNQKPNFMKTRSSIALQESLEELKKIQTKRVERPVMVHVCIIQTATAKELYAKTAEVAADLFMSKKEGHNDLTKMIVYHQANRGRMKINTIIDGEKTLDDIGITDRT